MTYFFIDLLGSCAITLLDLQQKQLKDGKGYTCAKLVRNRSGLKYRSTLMFVMLFIHLFDFREEDNMETQNINCLASFNDRNHLSS